RPCTRSRGTASSAPTSASTWRTRTGRSPCTPPSDTGRRGADSPTARTSPARRATARRPSPRRARGRSDRHGGPFGPGPVVGGSPSVSPSRLGGGTRAGRVTVPRRCGRSHLRRARDGASASAAVTPVPVQRNLMELAGPLLIGAVVVGALLLLGLIGFIYAKVRFKIASPDEALIITGRKSGKPVINPETGQETTDLSGQRVVIGGGTLVKPVFEQVARLSLASQSFPVTAEDATTKSGIGVTLRSIAVVKV